MYLIDNIYFIFSNLGRYPDPFNKISYVINRVVGCSIQFVNIKRGRIIE